MEEDRKLERLNLMINEDVRKKFKLKCVENNISMSQVVTNFIINYIKEN